MTLTLINGRYRIAHTAPDGDSVRFYPDDPTAFTQAHLHVHTNQAGGTQLRLDGIDALETHYRPPVSGLGEEHQPLAFAHAAAAEILTFLGFTHVDRGRGEVVTAAQPAEVPGYILTRFGDKYGRCVAFAFPGVSNRADLSEVFLDVPWLEASANYHLLTQGLVYPTYYSKLFPDLRQAMTAAVTTARSAQQGLWPKDSTQTGVTIEGMTTLTDRAVLLPKLFRRLLDYLALNDGSSSLAGFTAYLASRDDRLFILSTGHATGFDYVVAVDGQQVRLTNPPEDLVFIEG